jgi:hypothetical protein
MIVMTRDTAVPATAGDPFAELFQPAAPIFDAVMTLQPSILWLEKKRRAGSSREPRDRH